MAFSPDKLPAPFRCVNQVVGWLDRLTGKSWFDLSARKAMDIAARQTELSDFGPGKVEELLAVSCTSLTAEPLMTPLGRYLRRAEILHWLRNRLHVLNEVKIDPALREGEIRQPIFIVGMPRTGTTLLQRLLVLDPANRSPLFWETTHLFPLPVDVTSPSDSRIRLAERNLRFFDWVAPQIKTIHESGAKLPEECLGLLTQGLITGIWIDQSEKTREWVEAQDLSETYQLHKIQLQILQRGTTPRRWILKSPLHLLCLKWLLGTYPDATIVQTHRDPLEVFPSSASLFAHLAYLKYQKTDLRQIGRLTLQSLERALNSGEQVRGASRQFPDSKCRFLDVHYTDLVKAPLEVIQSIYETLGWSLSEETKSAMTAFLKVNRQHKFGKHRYSVEDFGFTPAEIRERFYAYFQGQG